MAWINLCASRHALREELDECLDDVEGFEIDSVASYAGLLALMLGDRSQLDRVAKLCRPTFEAYAASLREDPKRIFAVQALSDVFTLSVVEHLVGVPQVELWRWIADLSRFANIEMRSLQNSIGDLVELPRERKQKVFLGHVESDLDWRKVLTKRPHDHLLDLSLSPDHPRWLTLSRYVPALALVVAAQRAEAGQEVDPLDLFSQGSRPGRHPRVLYERVAERPDPLSEPDPQDPSTWYGFEAVEVLAEELVVYHFVSFRWQAPLLFAEDLNAFHFLDTLDLSWSQVKSNVEPQVWKEIQALRDSDRCRHVVVYDSSVAAAYEDDLEGASQAYGLRLEAADLTEV
ncbi:MAG: hypothetical protein K0U98_20575 [Deltaproteobacteria bacterium]|nr:hypothetical protein [Deltaproteobacteria bacterium]